jgi:uncharacterized repeat protein (TIGR03806 family)
VELSGGEVKALATDVVPFAPNTPLYSDGAIKRGPCASRRATPPPTTIRTALGFPDGTVFTKSFGFRDDARNGSLPIRWIETRLEWRAGGGLALHGLPLERRRDRGGRGARRRRRELLLCRRGWVTQHPNYLIPQQAAVRAVSRRERPVGPLSPKARWLNGDLDYGSGPENQLAHWTRLGILSGSPDPGSAPRLPDAADPAAGTLEERARAYLEANCGFCHSPQGNAAVSGLFLQASVTDPVQYGVCKHPVAAGPGAGGRLYDVVPGEPDASIVPYRMESTAPAVAMPQIGRSVVDAPGVELVRQWNRARCRQLCTEAGALASPERGLKNAGDNAVTGPRRPCSTAVAVRTPAAPNVAQEQPRTPERSGKLESVHATKEGSPHEPSPATSPLGPGLPGGDGRCWHCSASPPWWVRLRRPRLATAGPGRITPVAPLSHHRAARGGRSRRRCSRTQGTGR